MTIQTVSHIEDEIRKLNELLSETKKPINRNYSYSEKVRIELLKVAIADLSSMLEKFKKSI